MKEKAKLIKSVTTHEAKTTLSKLLRLVEAGGTVQICRNEQPIAELRSISSKPSSVLSPHPQLSKVVFAEDPSSPVSAEDWPEEFR